jgi:formylglycine-generating enzyme
MKRSSLARSRRRHAAVVAAALAAVVACSRRRDEPRPAPRASESGSASGAAAVPEPPPRLLYLPDAAPIAPAVAVPASAPRASGTRCPPEMVDVRGRFCIDRFEATLVDVRTGQGLSPYFHPTLDATRREYERWQRIRQEAKTPVGRLLPVPAPPEWELGATRLEPMAVSAPDVVPNGYLSGEGAEHACATAGKRLCSGEEWVVACRGEQNRKFPYGDAYEEGRCNVFRATHPARVLHGDPSTGHLDPRLNQVEEGTEPLLRHTGATPDCKSDWGSDAVYDMVGNLDEWVDDPDGTFLGGFYSRSTREGCDARIEVHAYTYYDYSLGVRCCR